MIYNAILLSVSSIALFAALTYKFSWVALILLAVAFIYIIRSIVCNVRKKFWIHLINKMTYMEFSKLYSFKIMMHVNHRIYDHAQVLLSLAKWADTKAENDKKIYERVLSHLEQPVRNSAMMDIILTITYLLACKKDPTMEETELLIGRSNFTNNHISAYTLYMEVINECTTLNTIITVNDTGKDWHIDDAVALFVLFDVLMLAKTPDIRLYIIGAGKYPETATHNHKVLATGILGDEIRQVYFLNSPGGANEVETGMQHVIKFEKNDSSLPSTCSSEVFFNLQHVDIVAFCAEPSCVESIVNITGTVGGIQGGFEKSSDGTYKGFNTSQSYVAAMALEKWTASKVNYTVCATKRYAENLSSHGTDMFNKLLQVIGVFSIDMQLLTLLRNDPIRYNGITTVMPDPLISNRLYDELTPLLVQLGILHNPSVWISSMPSICDQLTNPVMIYSSAAFAAKTLKRKLLLFLLIVMIKCAFVF